MLRAGRAPPGEAARGAQPRCPVAAACVADGHCQRLDVEPHWQAAPHHSHGLPVTRHRRLRVPTRKPASRPVQSSAGQRALLPRAPERSHCLNGFFHLFFPHTQRPSRGPAVCSLPESTPRGLQRGRPSGSAVTLSGRPVPSTAAVSPPWAAGSVLPGVRPNDSRACGP